MKLFYDNVFLATVGLEIGTPDNQRLAAHVEIQEKKNSKGVEVRYVVRIENKENFYTLLHDCLHLVRHIFVDRGIPFDDTNHELIAYYQTYWFKRLWRAVNKK